MKGGYAPCLRCSRLSRRSVTATALLICLYTLIVTSIAGCHVLSDKWTHTDARTYDFVCVLVRRTSLVNRPMFY